MGLAVYLEDADIISVESKCHSCGAAHIEKIRKEYFHKSITHNLGKMAASCGLYDVMWRPEENGIETAAQMIPFLREGIRSLYDDPEEHMRHQPENGFGSYDYLLRFATMYLDACESFPLSNVRVER